MFGANLQTIPPGVDGYAALRELQQRVAGKDGPTPGSNEENIQYLRCEHTLVRFLIARQWNVEKAATMLREHYRWLTEIQMEKLLLDPFPEEPQIKLYYPQAFHGTDKKGRPIYIERPGLIDMRRLLQYITPERLLEYFFASSERQLRRRLPACSLVRGEVVDKSLNIMDLQGLGFSLVTHTTARKVLREVVQMLQNHYPECSGQMIIINAPKVFSMAWSFVKPMLDEKTVSKIQIYGSDKDTWKETLLKLVEKDQLPSLFGGSCKCDGVHADSCIKQTKGPWTDPEILQILETTPLEYLLTPKGSQLLAQRRAEAAQKSSQRQDTMTKVMSNTTADGVESPAPESTEIVQKHDEVDATTNDVSSIVAESIGIDTLTTEVAAPTTVVDEVLVITENLDSSGGKDDTGTLHEDREDVANGEAAERAETEGILDETQDKPHLLEANEDTSRMCDKALKALQAQETVVEDTSIERQIEQLPNEVEETGLPSKEDTADGQDQNSAICENDAIEDDSFKKQAVDENIAVSEKQNEEGKGYSNPADSDDQPRLVTATSFNSVTSGAEEKEAVVCHTDSFFSASNDSPKNQPPSPQRIILSPQNSPGNGTLSDVEEEEEVSAEELQDAELEVQCLLEECGQHEEMHMSSLMAWVKQSNTLTREIGRDIIERAQAYYDCEYLLKQTVADYYELQQKVDRIDCELEKARANLSIAESAMESFMMGGSDLTEEEWTRLAPLPECDDPLLESATTDKKLLRSLRVSALSDSLVRLQSEREETIATRDSKGPEMEKVKLRFDEAQSQHLYCSWNCSVKRAEPFYRKRQAHEDLVTSQLSMLDATERRLQKALRQLSLLQQAQAKPAARKSRRGGRVDAMNLEIAGAEPSEEEFRECQSLATSSVIH